MFIGTRNNPDTTCLESYLKAWHTTGGAAYVTGQLERGGKEKTLHLQFFLQFPKPGKRITALSKHDSKAHYEVVKINNGADEYCNKEDTRVDGPWSFGVKPARQNLKGDVARRNAELIAKGAEQAVLDGDIRLEQYRSVSAAIDQIKLKTLKPYTPSHDRGVWIYGPSRTGKSTHARDKYSDHFDKQQNKWFDGYTGQKTIILDDLDQDVLGHHLKRWMDVHPCNGECKGSTIPLQHDWFVVTSNQSIEELFKNKPEMIQPIQERCKNRIYHFDQPFKFMKKQETEELVDELSDKVKN